MIVAVHDSRPGPTRPLLNTGEPGAWLPSGEFPGEPIEIVLRCWNSPRLRPRSGVKYRIRSLPKRTCTGVLLRSASMKIFVLSRSF